MFINIYKIRIIWWYCGYSVSDIVSMKRSCLMIVQVWGLTADVFALELLHHPYKLWFDTDAANICNSVDCCCNDEKVQLGACEYNVLQCFRILYQKAFIAVTKASYGFAVLFLFNSSSCVWEDSQESLVCLRLQFLTLTRWRTYEPAMLEGQNQPFFSKGSSLITCHETLYDVHIVHDPRECCCQYKVTLYFTKHCVDSHCSSRMCLWTTATMTRINSSKQSVVVLNTMLWLLLCIHITTHSSSHDLQFIQQDFVY